MRRDGSRDVTAISMPAKLEVWALAYPGFVDYLRHGALRDAEYQHPARELLSVPDPTDLDGEDRGF